MKANKKKLRINKRKAVNRVLRRNEIIDKTEEELVQEIAEAVEEVIQDKVDEITEETVADVIEDVVEEVTENVDEEIIEEAEQIADDLIEQVVEEIVEDIVEQVIEEEENVSENEDDEEEEEDKPITNRKRGCGCRTTTNRKRGAQTLDDWIGSIPDRELREFVVNSRKQQQEHRQSLIKGLAANRQCAFSLSELQKMRTNQLEKLAKSMSVSANDYSGVGMPRVNQSFYTTNSDDTIPAPPSVLTAKKGGK